MKKVAVLFMLTLFTFSCGSLQSMKKKELEEFKNVKKFNLNDFRVYVFNICEKYGKGVDKIERFCECPDDFYKVALQDQVMKVEELYLLMHRKTDLVLYLTTESHKYIRNDLTDFLNDPTIYKDNIALEEIESIFIGKYDLKNNLIHFPSYKDDKDIILHFDSDEYPKQILLNKANIATAENDYDIAETIPLTSTFKEKLKYKLESNYSIRYYNEKVTRNVDSIFIISEKGEVSVAFGFSDYPNFFKLTGSEVKYHPNFSLIQTH
jgi:hypothetical protein